MAKYSLRTYCGPKLLERFDHRSVDKLLDILRHPRHHKAGETGPFGEPEEHADRFEIRDSLMEKIFVGNVESAEAFTKKLKR
jgi:hypothetical protein